MIRQGRHTFQSETLMRFQFADWLRKRRITQWTWLGAAPHARIEHGRWLVDCPSCNGAELGGEEWDGVICGSCGAEFLTIIWPAPSVRAAIEAVLDVRPQHRQHWFPHEQLKDLEKENEDHGLKRKVS